MFFFLEIPLVMTTLWRLLTLDGRRLFKYRTKPVRRVDFTFVSMWRFHHSQKFSILFGTQRQGKYAKIQGGMKNITLCVYCNLCVLVSRA